MSKLEEYVADIFDFEGNQDPASFEERSGPPQELPAVVGLVSINFQKLEDELSARIIQMMKAPSNLGEVVVSELSYRNKVNVFQALYKELKSTHKFNSLPGYEEGYFRELSKALHKCGNLRNQVMHSKLVHDWQNDRLLRKKKATRGKRGFIEIEEEVTIPYLYNISDFIISMQMEVDQFFIDWGPKA